MAIAKRLLWSSKSTRDLSDDLQVDLARAAVAVAKGNLYSPGEALNRVEDAAYTASCLFYSLARQMDRQTRPSTKTNGRQIAATIRRHKHYVALPGRRRDDVVRSLMNVVEAVQEGDWDRLIVAEPPPRFQGLFWKVVLRIGLATALLVAGVLMPQLDFVSPDNADKLRATLFLSAAFAILIPDIKNVRDILMPFTRSDR